MPIAPITGKLRKRLWLDLTTSLGLGISAAYGWCFLTLTSAERRQEEYYLKLERERAN
ncbi:cytochrome-c oxidase [Vararia minispora EC-137]|uniref:Cytochrome-c oxidase n=1 Tax=Vararia minispora EC-137 TaxID=1314806 RepID=A0ACB8QQJ4_9AGAM|nr:cytochrome-c oxidase [Vararia minispora EC-137]